MTKAKCLKVQPAAKWAVTPKDTSVNGKIVNAIKAKANTVELLVKHFEKDGLAPTSKQYKEKPASYITGYISYLKKQNIVA